MTTIIVSPLESQEFFTICRFAGWKEDSSLVSYDPADHVQPFTAPKVNPLTIYFCITNVNKTTGIVMTKEIAAI